MLKDSCFYSSAPDEAIAIAILVLSTRQSTVYAALQKS